MGSLLEKIYSGSYEEVQLWVAIAEIDTDTIMSMQMACKHLSGLQSTSVYNCNQSNLSGLVRVLILQAISALHDKRFAYAHETIKFFLAMCTATANES